MKRFYKAVGVTAENGILLDSRPVRTPAKALLILPNNALAKAVAGEWCAQKDDIDPHAMPFTGLANAAIDRVAPDRASFASGLSAYGENELLCYRAAEPPPLVERQNIVWNPLLDWAQSRFDVNFTLVTGIMHQPQPPETLARLSTAMTTHDPFQLAALSPMVTIGGSLVLALAVADGALTPEAAFDAAHLDELWQEEMWGADYFALQTRAAHRTDFLAACRFFELAK